MMEREKKYKKKIETQKHSQLSALLSVSYPSITFTEHTTN
jgi:hypothetical protein